jgi:hypothetical protein
MAAEHLTEDMKASGAAMLAELDKIGLEPTGALWLHFPIVKDWRYAVVSPLVDTMGRRKVYGLIDDALEAIGKTDAFTILDIHLYSSSEIVPRLLGHVVNAENSSVALENVTVNGVTFDALIYRLTPPPPAKQVRRVERQFENAVRKLAA